MGGQLFGFVPRHAGLETAAVQEHLLRAPRHGNLEQVHRRTADKSRHERVDRTLIELLRGADLLERPLIHDGDARGHSHGLHLIVGDIDKGGLQPLVELADLRPGLDPELGVQVGEGLVQQKHGRLSDNGPAQGHSLPLAAR